MISPFFLVFIYEDGCKNVDELRQSNLTIGEAIQQTEQLGGLLELWSHQHQVNVSPIWSEMFLENNYNKELLIICMNKILSWISIFLTYSLSRYYCIFMYDTKIFKILSIFSRYQNTFLSSFIKASFS